MTAVVLVMGSSMADAVGGIGRAYRPAFEKLGYEFVEINLLDQSKAVQQLNDLARMKVEFGFGFMAMGTDIKVETPEGSGDIWEMLHIPYVSLYGDSPSYYFDRHVLPNPNYVALYGFPEHCELRKRFPNINGLIDTYNPVAIDAVAKNEIDFKAKAEGVIILLKNGNDPQKLIDLWSSLSPKIGSALLELASELRARIDDKATTQIDDLVLRYFQNRGVAIERLYKLRLFLIAQLDDYLRRIKSTMVVEALLDFPVLLNGYNWDHIDFTGKRLKYVPGGEYTASTGLIREALAILDMSPNTGRAPHDRPLRAFGAHTLCLTNEQEFFSKELPHTDEFFYRFNPESIRARVAGAMQNRQKTLDVGVAVAEAFTQKFPAERFAQQLLTMAPLARFNQLPGVPDGTPNYFAWPPTRL